MRLKVDAKGAIQTGLIDRHFESIIAKAHQHNIEELRQSEEEAFALLNTVEALYPSIDNSLWFPAEAKATA